MIHITNHLRKIRLPRAKISVLARRLAGRKSLSIAFVGDREIRKLNRRHLRHDRATDVLAFPLGSDLFGEVIVSAETAGREAHRRGIRVEEELLRYVAHGILHLLGYDDRRPRDRERMWKRQEREVRRLF